ncbi:hypothetical protein H6P81_013031 [Aristolochia fimbriata]|uniref:Uncharacterized protein n=1 Tax=Aristolochia fimbriata TaxID=158543 RepID=A0AAV7EDK0_ARIFI|nr:hypothetical protein H6P81_013031 [Aristolochia fimbriata]
MAASKAKTLLLSLLLIAMLITSQGLAHEEKLGLNREAHVILCTPNCKGDRPCDLECKAQNYLFGHCGVAPPKAPEGNYCCCYRKVN